MLVSGCKGFRFVFCSFDATAGYLLHFVFICIDVSCSRLVMQAYELRLDLFAGLTRLANLPPLLEVFFFSSYFYVLSFRI